MMLCIHAISTKKYQKSLPVGRWSKQGCIKSAREYDFLKTWIRERKTAYLAARDSGWLEECCAHMEPLFEKWTTEKCKESALKYTNLIDWRASEPNSYGVAQSRGWLSECCAHMKVGKRFVTKQDCINAAMQLSRIDDFFKHEHYYFKCAKEQGWLPEIKDILDMYKARVWLDKKFGGPDGER
jgi:hypothetical protein